MRARFFIDPETGLPHIYEHDVSENEALDVLRKPIEETRGRRDTIVAHGQTQAGRYLKVVYSPDVQGDGIFIVTAYDLNARQLHALRRRMRRRQRP
jgi:hypothetical protein